MVKMRELRGQHEQTASAIPAVLYYFYGKRECISACFFIVLRPGVEVRLGSGLGLYS